MPPSSLHLLLPFFLWRPWLLVTKKLLKLLVTTSFLFLLVRHLLLEAMHLLLLVTRRAPIAQRPLEANYTGAGASAERLILSVFWTANVGRWNADGANRVEAEDRR